jgi:hypothetical protein
MAATLANFLMQKLQELHQHLQNQSNVSVLEKIKEGYELKQKEYFELADSLNENSTFTRTENDFTKAKKDAKIEQLKQYEKMIGEYQLAVTTNTPVLLSVENARPSLWPDKPRILTTVLFVFFSAALFSFLVALFVESRKHSV